MRQISRRDFFATAALGAAAAGRLEARRRIPVALELFSLRHDAIKDLPGTLAAISKMGYEGIELAGEKGGIGDTGAVYGRSARELRKLFDDAGLKVFSAHLLLPTLLGDKFERTVEFNETLGNPRATIAWLNPTKTIQPWYDYGKQFSEIAARLKKYKMQLAFHNHTHEFDLVEGKRPWDVFLESSSKDVMMQLHVAAFPARGLNIIDYIKRYPGRTRTMHLNDYSPEKRRVLLGEGTVDWKNLFAAAENTGKVELYIIEQESYPEPLTPIQCAERCLQNFRKLHG